MNGAPHAIATKYAPTAAPAVANEPLIACTCRSMPSVTVAIGVRASHVSANVAMRSGARRNAR
jgi:hypothetical protein